MALDQVISPAPGSKLTTSIINFTLNPFIEKSGTLWNAYYIIRFGTAKGKRDLFYSGEAALVPTPTDKANGQFVVRIAGLPADASTIYVQLDTATADGTGYIYDWQTRFGMYTAAGTAPTGGGGPYVPGGGPPTPIGGGGTPTPTPGGTTDPNPGGGPIPEDASLAGADIIFDKTARRIFDLDLNRADIVEVVFGDVPLVVGFVDLGFDYTLPGNSQLRFTLKPLGHFNALPLLNVIATASKDTGTLSAGENWGDEKLLPLLAHNKKYVDLLGQYFLRLPTDPVGRWRATRPLQIRLYNSDAAVNTPPPDDLPAPLPGTDSGPLNYGVLRLHVPNNGTAEGDAILNHPYLDNLYSIPLQLFNGDPRVNYKISYVKFFDHCHIIVTASDIDAPAAAATRFTDVEINWSTGEYAPVDQPGGYSPAKSSGGGGLADLIGPGPGGGGGGGGGGGAGADGQGSAVVGSPPPLPAPTYGGPLEYTFLVGATVNQLLNFVNANSLEIVSGALPPGLHVEGFFVRGTPTGTVHDYSVSFRATGTVNLVRTFTFHIIAVHVTPTDVLNVPAVAGADFESAPLLTDVAIDIPVFDLAGFASASALLLNQPYPSDALASKITGTARRDSVGARTGSVTIRQHAHPDAGTIQLPLAINVIPVDWPDYDFARVDWNTVMGANPTGYYFIRQSPLYAVAAIDPSFPLPPGLSLIPPHTLIPGTAQNTGDFYAIAGVPEASGPFNVQVQLTNPDYVAAPISRALAIDYTP